VHYTGYLAADGTKFDSSLDRGEPISFPYGQHRVIQGWDTGFEGMHIGGKRRLFIPYQLAYGETGKPPVIPAKSTLVFDVELIGQSDEQPKPPAPKPAPAPTTPPPAAAPAAGAAAKPATTAPAATPPPATPKK
jgi:peptidylprolyl isomerase